jgi:cytochrome c oxidase subunit IV
MPESSAPAPSRRLYVLVWIALLLIVAAEVVLTYAGLTRGRLLGVLLVLALIEAGLGVGYFMHVRYERRILLWTLGILVFSLVMMNQFWSDAVRVHTMHP